MIDPEEYSDLTETPYGPHEDDAADVRDATTEAACMDCPCPDPMTPEDDCGCWCHELDFDAYEEEEPSTWDWPTCEEDA